MRRRLLSILGILMFLSTLFHNFSFAQKETITYWFSIGGIYEEGMRKIVDKFNKSHPNIEVKMTYVEHGQWETFEKLQTAIAAGTPPDAAFFERSFVDQWAAKGLFLPLDEYLTPEEREGKIFLQNAWEEVVYKSKIYAIPIWTDIRGLYWNKDLFKEAGLPDRAPRTLAELDKFAEKLTKFDEKGKIQAVGFIPWWGNWFFPAWSWTFGGKIVDRKTLKVTANDPKNIQALEWITSYAKKYGIQAIATFGAGFTGGLNNPFFMGKEAMEANGQWMLKEIERYAPRLNFDVAPVPHPPGGANGTWCGGFANVIPKGSRHPKEAAEFIRWLASEEAQIDIYKLLGAVPINKKALEKVKLLVSSKERKFYAQFPYAHGRTPLWVAVFNECLVTVDEAIYSKKTPKQALDDMQIRLEKIFKEFFGD